MQANQYQPATITRTISDARAISQALARCADARTAAQVSRGHVMALVFSPELGSSYHERARLQSLIHEALAASEAVGAADARHARLCADVTELKGFLEAPSHD